MVKSFYRALIHEDSVEALRWMGEARKICYGTQSILDEVIGHSQLKRAVRPRQILIRAMWDSGMGLSEIGRMLGRDHSTIAYHLGRIPKKWQKWKARFEKMGRVIRCDLWEEQDLKTLRDMKAAGFTHKEIGIALNRSRSAISGQLDRLKKIEGVRPSGLLGRPPSSLKMISEV